MENFGINIGYIFWQLFNFAVLVLWLVLVMASLLTLRKQSLSSISQALWVLIILAIPFLGAIVFWLVRPSESVSSETK